MQAPPNENFVAVLDRLESKLNDLKFRYEQYFLGLEKLEPINLREEVAKMVRRYTTTSIQNTGHRFRLNSIVARFNSFQTHWNRILREMEEGQSKRDRFRKKLVGDAPKPPSETPSAAKGKAAANQANDPITQLYNQYVSAKEKNSESTKGITRDKMAAMIKQQAATIKERFQCKRVTFKVVVEEGKAKIKAVPKNE